MENYLMMIKKGKGYIKEFNYFGELEYEGEYINGEKEMEKEKDIIQKANYYLKVSI